ncbi:bacteriocin [Thalassomonas haliotis]|uniref:Bacteriocin n=1 Tax=Thalassomonas haliotis TaxID=485448 RepID=A0ABY7VF60_9GAMM|nr:bacteriocin [Thalassomonas haliotis]WDE12333.1 bacteriocin [Thalassomonas haliotis]
MMNQKLTFKELKQVTGGSGIDTGVKPKAMQLIAPVEDTQLVSASLDDEKDKKLP